MIPPAGPDAGGPCRAAMPMSNDVSPTRRCFVRLRADFGNRLQRHRRIRLRGVAIRVCSDTKRGWIPWRSRQCLRPRSDFPVATASNQPSASIASSNSITPSNNGSSTRPSARAPKEFPLIAFGELRMVLRAEIRRQNGHRLDQAQPDYGAAGLWRRTAIRVLNVSATALTIVAPLSTKVPSQSKIASRVTGALLSVARPRLRRSPFRSRRRDFAAAATLRSRTSELFAGSGRSIGSMSPAIASKPNSRQAFGEMRREARRSRRSLRRRARESGLAIHEGAVCG